MATLAENAASADVANSSRHEAPSAHVLQTIESILTAARQVHGRCDVDSMLLEWTRSQLAALARAPAQAAELAAVLAAVRD